MKVVILGGQGMLGHRLFVELDPRFEVWATFRDGHGLWRQFPAYRDCVRTVAGVDALNMSSVVKVLADLRPDAIINCIGIIKQLKAAKDPIPSLRLNALFPHELYELCRAAGCRLLHISTDCVFSGARGGYQEDDPADAQDLYGRTKHLGEVAGECALTLRTSIIGRDFLKNEGLVEWFLSQRGGRVRGFKHAIFSGLTTHALSQLIGDLLERHPGLDGLFQVASEPINKYDLLVLMRQAMGLTVQIDPDEELRIDRSLNGARFECATGLRPPSWATMIDGLARDLSPYDQWRLEHGIGR